MLSAMTQSDFGSNYELEAALQARLAQSQSAAVARAALARQNDRYPVGFHTLPDGTRCQVIDLTNNDEEEDGFESIDTTEGPDDDSGDSYMTDSYNTSASSTSSRVIIELEDRDDVPIWRIIKSIYNYDDPALEWQAYEEESGPLKCGAWVIFIVGEDEDQTIFQVNKEFICDNSNVANRAFHGMFREGRTQTFWMSEFDPFFFKCLLTYLFDRQDPCKRCVGIDEWAWIGARDKLSIGDLNDVRILADYLDIKEMDAYRSRIDNRIHLYNKDDPIPIAIVRILCTLIEIANEHNGFPVNMLDYMGFLETSKRSIVLGEHNNIQYKISFEQEWDASYFMIPDGTELVTRHDDYMGQRQLVAPARYLYVHDIKSGTYDPNRAMAVIPLGRLLSNDRLTNRVVVLTSRGQLYALKIHNSTQITMSPTTATFFQTRNNPPASFRDGLNSTVERNDQRFQILGEPATSSSSSNDWTQFQLDAFGMGGNPNEGEDGFMYVDPNGPQEWCVEEMGDVKDPFGERLAEVLYIGPVELLMTALSDEAQRIHLTVFESAGGWHMCSNRCV